MIKHPLTEDSLRKALGHIRDFAAVHNGKGDYPEALAVLRDSLGIDSDALECFSDEAQDILGEGSQDSSFLGGALLGLIVGLIASDYALQE